jgi:hypothetical protein
MQINIGAGLGERTDEEVPACSLMFEKSDSKDDQKQYSGNMIAIGNKERALLRLDNHNSAVKKELGITCSSDNLTGYLK